MKIILIIKIKKAVQRVINFLTSLNEHSILNNINNWNTTLQGLKRTQKHFLILNLQFKFLKNQFQNCFKLGGPLQNFGCYFLNTHISILKHSTI